MMKDMQGLKTFALTLAYSYFGNGTLYRLARRRANDRNRCAEQHEELWEGVSPLILLYSVVAIALQYSYNTH